MRTTAMTRQQAADLGKCQRIYPGEQAFVDAGIPVKRKYRKDGSYTWRAPFKPNEGGKLTRQASAVLEMMTPGAKADSERHSALQERRERAVLRDSDGATRIVDAALADETARRNGWCHRWMRGRRHRIERGADGMLFRLVAGEWLPTGVRCLGTPLRGGAAVSKRGLQRDPDGSPWRWVAGEWRRCDEESG